MLPIGVGLKAGALLGLNTLLEGLNEFAPGVKLGAFVLGLNSVTLALIGGAASVFFCVPLYGKK